MPLAAISPLLAFALANVTKMATGRRGNDNSGRARSRGRGRGRGPGGRAAEGGRASSRPVATGSASASVTDKRSHDANPTLQADSDAGYDVNQGAHPDADSDADPPPTSAAYSAAATICPTSSPLSDVDAPSPALPTGTESAFAERGRRGIDNGGRNATNATWKGKGKENASGRASATQRQQAASDNTSLGFGSVNTVSGTGAGTGAGSGTRTRTRSQTSVRGHIRTAARTADTDLVESRRSYYSTLAAPMPVAAPAASSLAAAGVEGDDDDSGNGNDTEAFLDIPSRPLVAVALRKYLVVLAFYVQAVRDLLRLVEVAEGDDEEAIEGDKENEKDTGNNGLLNALRRRINDSSSTTTTATTMTTNRNLRAPTQRQPTQRVRENGMPAPASGRGRGRRRDRELGRGRGDGIGIGWAGVQNGGQKDAADGTSTAINATTDTGRLAATAATATASHTVRESPASASDSDANWSGFFQNHVGALTPLVAATTAVEAAFAQFEADVDAASAALLGLGPGSLSASPSFSASLRVRNEDSATLDAAMHNTMYDAPRRAGLCAELAVYLTTIAALEPIREQMQYLGQELVPDVHRRQKDATEFVVCAEVVLGWLKGVLEE